MKNKWKLAFWISFCVLIIITYFTIDRSISEANLQVNYSRSRSDLHQLSKIMSESDLSRKRIQEILSENGYESNENNFSDTIHLNYLKLIFHNDQLAKVIDR